MPPSLPESVPVIIAGETVATRVLEPQGAEKGQVVLCHGTPWSSRVWTDVALDLSGDHRVFLWDMPGYGESSRGQGVDTGLRAQGERLALLLRHWGLRRPHVIAHDVGAAVALRAHLLHGSEYADLFLWDGVVLEPWGSDFFRLVAEHPDVFLRLPSRLHAALVKEYVAGALARTLPSPVFDELLAPWQGDEGREAFYRQIASLRVEDTRSVAERLGSVRAPTRIGWGSDDPWIPVSQAYGLQALLPGSPEVVVLDGAGHLTPREDPAGVTAALRTWLARGAGDA